MSSGLAKRKIDDPSAGLKKQRVEGKDEKKTEKILIGRVYYDSMDDYIKESMAMFGTLHKELKQKMEKFDRCEKSWDDYFAGKITIDKIERDD